MENRKYDIFDYETAEKFIGRPQVAHHWFKL